MPSPGSRGSPSPTSRPSPPSRHPPPPPPPPPYDNDFRDMRYGHGHGNRRGPSRSPYDRPSRPQVPSTTVLGWTPRAPGTRRDRDARDRDIRDNRDGPPPPSSSSDRVGNSLGNGIGNGNINGGRDMMPPMASPPSRRPIPPARSPIMRPLPRVHSPSGSVPAPNTPTPTSGNGNGAHTPSWLTGRYRSSSAAASTIPVPSSSPINMPINVSMSSISPSVPVITAAGSIQAYCKDRLDTICAVVDSTCTTDAIPELRKVMENLEYSKIDIENEIANKARQERIRAYRRIEKSRRELRKAERHLLNVDLQAQHIESKIRRLSEYSAFIENKWRDADDSNNSSDGRDKKEKKVRIDKVELVAKPSAASAPS